VKDVIHKIYPVLYADEFQLGFANYMESSCFEPVRHKLRQDMLLTALKRDQPARPGQPARKALEDMTTFKPFNVRETNWEVWDVKDYMTEQYYKAH